MDQDRWRRVRELFESAHALEAEQREALLEERCGDDTELRAEVESLLRGEGETGDPLAEAVGKAAADLGEGAIESKTSPTSRISLSRLAPAHLREVRLWWVYALAVALSLYALGETIYWTATVGDTTSPGFTYQPPLLVRMVSDGPAREAGIEALDRVTAIDGAPVFDARELDRRLDAVGPGREVEIELERTDRGRFTVTLPTVRGGATLITFLVQLRGLVWVSTGLLLFWFHPGRQESWAFLAATLAVGLPGLMPVPDFHGGAYLPLPYALSRGWSVAVEGFIAPSCVAFFLLFPYPPSFVARRLWLVPLLFAPALVWTALFLPTYPWYPAFPRWERLADASYLVLVALTPVAVLVALAILIWRFRQPHPPKQAAQLRALVVAFALSFPLPVLVYAASVVSPQWATESWPIYPLGLNLPLLIFPPMVAYAIARHDLFEIDRLVARAAAYSVAVLVAGLAYAGAVVVLPSALAPRALAERPWVMALIILAAITALRPLRDRVMVRIERTFRRQHPDPEARVHALRDALRALSRGASREIFSRLERLIERSFDLDRVRFLEPAGGGWRTAVATAGADGVDTGFGRAPIELGVERILPMQVGGELVGALGIGRPISGAALGSTDERALEAVALEAGRALRRSDPGQRIGDYRVLRLLASGGMGSVYLAVREGVAGFAKQVALKELLPERAADLEVVRRFLTEARVAAQLDHPNIVHTYDLGETDQGYFIAMEYVPGIDAGTLLRELERRRALLPLPAALHIVSSVCLALDFAHGAKGEDGQTLGLVHRDVSPQNVLLSESGDVKLVDFGVAQLTYGDAKPGALVGKVAYMAPEQLRREPTDRRADLFAAGVLLYELATGVHPFRKPSHRATWDAILRGSFLAPETLRPGLAVQISQIIQRALGSKPENRYQSAAQMAEALQKVTAPSLRVARQLGEIVSRLGAAAQEGGVDSGTTVALEATEGRGRTSGR